MRWRDSMQRGHVWMSVCCSMWTPTSSMTRLFGVATLAAGGSEGNGQHMAGMRWSQTANYGTLPSPGLPNSFVAQVYDLGDPW